MQRTIPVRRTNLADEGRTDHLVRLTPSEPRRIDVTVEALVVPVLGRDDFITNKKATGRPKDLSDLTLLPPA